MTFCVRGRLWDCEHLDILEYLRRSSDWASHQSIRCSAQLHTDTALATASIVYTLASSLGDLASNSHGHRHPARRRVGRPPLSRFVRERRKGQA